MWECFEDTARPARGYGYRNIRTPILERTALFVRSIGEVTDIVEKEMYTFTDQFNGDSLTLRPEATAASCARRSSTTCSTAARSGCGTRPMFRHERPQKGRYRQFHQIGVEALGFAGPDVDAELIIMCARLWKDLGLTGIELEINSIGDATSGPATARGWCVIWRTRRALDEDARADCTPIRCACSTARIRRCRR